MRKILFALSLFLVLTACKKKELPVLFVSYDETSELESQQKHENNRMKFKLIQSKNLDMNEVFKPFEEGLAYFSEKDYNNLKPYILEKDIPTIQEAVSNRILSYEQIVLFYLYRIRMFESDNDKALHSIIALNPDILEEAREKDKNRPQGVKNTLYGLPILLKDNINTVGMHTTAGAYALKDNVVTDDAFIVKKLKENGALILGKVNLSEWAYYFCGGCPLGYSAIGGQTLNPYGRKIFETGGSSSGSGVSTAANYAIAAVGTETSGSILSPSSKNSVVGLKPTIGLLSRTGIVPISSTLDTPGPMTKSVIDNAIFLEAMTGEDTEDLATKDNPKNISYLEGLSKATVKGKRLGVLKSLLKDTVYYQSIELLRSAGAEIIEIDPERKELVGFMTLLNIDMKHDLPKYLNNYADKDVEVRYVKDVIELNNKDTLLRAPYGQARFKGIVNDSTTLGELEKIKKGLHSTGKAFFDIPTEAFNLDAILSINNYHASFAAVAQYPCLTVPMGYGEDGEPISLTFISTPFSEAKLLQLGHAFEKISRARRLPLSYK